MPDDNSLTPPPQPTPTEPKRSFREIAEAAYDDLVEGGDGSAQPDGETGDGQSSRPRDTLGRFVSADQQAEPGEADGQQRPSQPRDELQAPPVEDAHPAPEKTGSSREPPAHWPANDREMWLKADPEMQAWALRREASVEGDYQRKVQGLASAANFVNAIAPSFSDPRVAASLQREGMSPVDAVNQLVGFHARFVDPNPQVRAGVLQELMARSGLDPAAVFQMSPPGIPGLTPEEQKDPAIQYIADTIGRLSQEVQAQRNAIAQQQANSTAQANEEAFRTAQWGVYQFAEAKDQQGNLLHPYFDNQGVMRIVYDLIAANPQRTMQEAYDLAVGANQDTRERLFQERQNAMLQQQSNVRARQAVRSNARGITQPVTGERPNGPVGLRATIEAAADDLGF